MVCTETVLIGTMPNRHSVYCSSVAAVLEKAALTCSGSDSAVMCRAVESASAEPFRT